MVEKLTTFLIVSSISLLIWLYAEGQKLDTRSHSARIKLNVPSNEFMVRDLTSPTLISIEVKGPTGPLSAVDETLARPIELTTGSHGIPSAPGQHTISLLEALRQQAIFPRGVSIASVDPGALTFTIDRWVNVPFEVQAGRIAGVELQEPPRFDPPQVNVRIAESLLRDLLPEQRRVVAVPENPDVLRTLPAGVPQTIETRLSMPDVANRELALITGGPVQMIVTIRSQRVEIVKSAAPVHVAMPPLDLDRFTVTLAEPVIPSLRISGPRDLIDQIERNELRIIGYLYFSSDELLKGITQKEVSFEHLPAGLVIESGPVIANFTITRKPDETGGGDV